MVRHEMCLFGPSHGAFRDGLSRQHNGVLDDGIEVGGGLGPDAPAIWRVGLMGPNANAGTADRVFEALDAAVTSQRAPVPARG